MLFSIITPVYNAERFVRKAIQSVLAQTYSQWELILIDDGSFDDSLHIMESYCAKNEKIRCFKQDNKGVSYTRNRGIELAQGEYILFLDADDEIDSITLETIHNALKTHPGDVVSFNAYRSDIYSTVTGEVTQPFSEQIMYLTNEQEKKKYIYTTLASNKTFGIMGVFAVKRSVLSDIRFRTDMAMYEDLLFDIQMYEKAQSVLCLPQYLYHYRDNPSSCVQNFNYKKIDDLKIAYQAKEELIKKYALKENREKILLWFCLTILSYYMSMLEDKKSCGVYIKHMEQDLFIYGKFQSLSKIDLPKNFPTTRLIFGNSFEKWMYRRYFLVRKKIKKTILR